MGQQQQQHQLHIFFFPMLAHGHMIPTLDMAKLFSSSAVRSTIITTPLNSLTFSNSIRASKHQIEIQIIDFPSAAAGLPEGIENVDQCTSDEMVFRFFKATALLQEPLEKLMGELQPNCLVADMFFPWATAAAAKFGIPRLVFHGTSFFALCASASVGEYKPFKSVTSDSEPFVLPNLPHDIKLIRTQIAQHEREETAANDFTEMLKKVRDSESESYGVIFNSFFELEPDYVNHYRNVLKRKAWHVGPLSLCNRDNEDKAVRGKKSAIDEHECLKWLDSQKPNSVIYVCFGSVANVSASQLYEVAMGLEASDQPFIWVVRTRKNREENVNNNWLPEGFEERIKGKGLIIKGWAPQVMILDHEAVGGFVTHCGWNSTLEGICAGVPMVTWPVFADQFYNEKLVTEVLRIGVSVGVKEWNRVAEGIRREVVVTSVKRVMVEEEGEEIRKRAKELKEKAKKAVEEGGSSYNDLRALIEELSSLKKHAK